MSPRNRVSGNNEHRDSDSNRPRETTRAVPRARPARQEERDIRGQRDDFCDAELRNNTSSNTARAARIDDRMERASARSTKSEELRGPAPIRLRPGGPNGHLQKPNAVPATKGIAIAIPMMRGSARRRGVESEPSSPRAVSHSELLRRMRTHHDLSSERTFPLTYLPLCCGNRPRQKTPTGPLPFDPKAKGPNHNLTTEARPALCGDRRIWC